MKDKEFGKICKDKKIKEMVDLYIEYLAKAYEGNPFTRADFETLNVNGKEVEQDVVLELFKNKDEVPAEEIFKFLLKKNVKTIKHFSIINDIISANSIFKVAGYFDFNKRKIVSSRSKQYITSRDIDYEMTLFHELSHIFEGKSFQKNKYYKIDNSRTILMKLPFGKFLYLKDKVSSEGIKQAKDKKSHDGKKMADTLMRWGSRAITEILNETFTIELSGKPALTEQRYFTKAYDTRFELAGSCGYNENYDIVELLKIAFNEENFKKYRFNSVKFIKKLDDVSIPSEKLDKIKNKIIEFSKIPSLGEKKFANEVKSKKVYDLLCLSMGSAGMSILNDRYVDLKMIAQSILIETINTNLQQDLKNPNIVKDKSFYERLDKNLITIDNFLYSKVKRYKKKHKNPADDLQNNLQTYEEIAKSSDLDINTESFISLLETVKEHLKQNPEKEITLEFFKKQQKILEKSKEEEIKILEPVQTVEKPKKQNFLLKKLKIERTQ